MRTLVNASVLAAALAVPAPAPAQSNRPLPPDSATTAELLAARDAIWRAWFANDTAALARLLPEAVAAGSGVRWQDRAAIVEESRRFAAGGGRLVDLSFTDTKIEVFGDLAVVQAHYRYELESAGERSATGGRATEIFVRRDGRWVNPFWYLQ